MLNNVQREPPVFQCVPVALLLTLGSTEKRVPDQLVLNLMLSAVLAMGTREQQTPKVKILM